MDRDCIVEAIAEALDEVCETDNYLVEKMIDALGSGYESDDTVEDIIEALDKTYGGEKDGDDYLHASCLKLLYEETGDKDFKREFENLCDRTGVCPICCEGRVRSVIIGSERLDCFGSYCLRDEYAMVCSNCGEEF